MIFIEGMEMYKFAVGPWVVEEDVRDYGEGEYIAGYDIRSASGEEVIGCEGINGDGETNRANAKLIAASPLMIEALQKIHFRCECFLEDERSMSLSSIEAIKSICDEVISKAI